MKIYIRSSSNSVIDTLISLGYGPNSRGEYAKYYEVGTGFTVFVNPSDGDCYFVDNAVPSEIDESLKPIDSPEKVLELDRLASIGISQIEESVEQYRSRMSKVADFKNGVWVKRHLGYR